MGLYKSLFKVTAIYGLATVLPRLLSFLLTPLYTTKGVLSSVAEFGEISIIFSYFVLFNVILTYGMETAFFRFFNSEKNKNAVVSTSTLALVFTTIGFAIIAFLFKTQIANLTGIKEQYIHYLIFILLFDTLVVIPFAWLRTTVKPVRYTALKVLNVVVNISLNLFFLIYLKKYATEGSFLNSIYIKNFEVNYIFIANLIASGLTLVLLLPFYIKLKYLFNTKLLKQMLRYAYPVLIAGIAFSINETFDRILLKHLLPENTADTQIGMYSACYKLAVFMTLFVTAYRLGIEPFFFSHANTKKPQYAYAKLMEIFVALGSIILLTIVVFANTIKPFIVRSEAYWEAMWIVPIVLLANLFLGIYHNLSVWYKITDRTKFGAYISAFGALITLAINLLFIKYYGYKASAIATLAAYATMMLLSYYFGKKHYPIPYNITKIGLYLGLSVLCSYISFYIFNGKFIVGIPLLISFISFVIFIERKPLRAIINSIKQN